MDLLLLPASELLRPYVKQYCALQLGKGDTRETVFAATTDNCILCFFDQSRHNQVLYTLHVPGNPQFLFDQTDFWLGGAHSAPLTAQWANETSIVGIVVTPLGLKALFGQEQQVWFNNGGPFSAIGLTDAFQVLKNDLDMCTEASTAISMIDRLLLQRLQLSDHVSSLSDVIPICDYIARKKGMVKMAELAKKFKVSSRWIEKQFEAQLGISPNDFARITKFRTILAHIWLEPKTPYTVLLHEYDFYDFSHLHKEFVKFTGSKPSEYFKDINLEVNQLFYKLEEELLAS